MGTHIYFLIGGAVKYRKKIIIPLIDSTKTFEKVTKVCTLQSPNLLGAEVLDLHNVEEKKYEFWCLVTNKKSTLFSLNINVLDSIFPDLFSPLIVY